MAIPRVRCRRFWTRPPVCMYV